ncbi:MAG TPA: hypothetical protein VFI97_03595 [Arthrobacter sp.]|nr:hypothetical protein [Arthrobacter sp.]
MPDKIFNVAGAIVTVALVTTLMTSPNSAAVIKGLGDAFAGSIRAALGKA